MNYIYDKLLYSRKSRQDNPLETIEEVLAKHETLLQEFAEREFGGRIPEENIFREVASGESIDERNEIKAVLARIEDPSITGVLVVEPSRLSRGDLEDCARIITSFRFSNTEVITPMMTYDLSKKMERKFFQDELLRGNDYLEYTKDILWRGRVQSAKRGCFINQHAPFGYNKVVIGKDHTLEPNENAEYVKMIFHWYANEDLSLLKICRKLREMGVSPPQGDTWYKTTIVRILHNPHYIGKVVFNRKKLTPVMEDGVVKKKTVKQAAEDVILVDGLHPAIIDLETWEKAKSKDSPTPRNKEEFELKNPLAGVLVCSQCGHVIYHQKYKKAEDRYICRTDPRCFRSVKVIDVIDAVVYALENSELPALEAKLKSDDGNARKIQARILENLEKKLAEYQEQEDTQYELLETKKYTQDVFDRRNSVLRKKMEECQAAIYQARSTMPEDIDYEEKIVRLKDAISALRDNEMKPSEKNKIVKAVVDRIEFTGQKPIPTNDKYKRNHSPFTIEVTLRL